MTDTIHQTILRRMAAQPAPEAVAVPQTSSRAMRVAVTRAADDTVGLVMTILGIGEEQMGLEDLVPTLRDDLLMLALRRHGASAGVIAMDIQLMGALIEMQTMGRLGARAADPRPPTGTDAAMVGPFAAAVVQGVMHNAPLTPLDGWLDEVDVGDRSSDTRALGLALDDARFRVVRLSIDLGQGDRQGELMIGFPHHMVDHAPISAPHPHRSWGQDMQLTVSGACATLDAVLHRLRMPIGDVEKLQVGQIVALPGATVGSVQMLAPEGHVAAPARLGQAAGMRAVRLETPALPQLGRIMPKTAAAAGAIDAESRLISSSIES